MRTLFLVHEFQQNAANIDYVPIMQSHGRLYALSINLGLAASEAQIVTVLVLIDLRGYLRREPPAQAYRGHWRLADNSELIRQQIVLLACFALEYL
jgi:hypothetical protein